MLQDANPWDVAEADAETLRERLGRADATVVLGSGWARVATELGTEVDQMQMTDLAGVPAPSVQGHGGTITAVEVGPKRVFVMAGRVHLYEGHSAHTVAHAVRTAVLSGCSTMMLTNAAGSLRAGAGIGTPVLLTDQLNLTGTSPLAGPPPPDHLGSRFVDMTGLYDPDLRSAVMAADPHCAEGVYAGLLGGAFETPAEVRMLGSLGADVVGMSTVLEAIAARHLGARCFGVSLVTNLAAGLQESLDHREVLAAGDASVERLAGVLDAAIAAC